MCTLLDKIESIAKQNLVKYGYLEGMVFITHGESLVIDPLPMSLLDGVMNRISGDKLGSYDYKSKTALAAGGLCRKHCGDRVILIWDAAFMTCDIASRSELEKPENAPLTQPRGLRTECLIINDIKLPSGEDRIKVTPYKGGLDGKKWVGPVEFLEKTYPDEAKFESRFTELILKGYNAADKMLRRSVI